MSFGFPAQYLDFIQKYKTSAAECKISYSLVHRDLGAHNVLVNEDFDIVGLIDLDSVMAAPPEVGAQFKSFMHLNRPTPGFVETGRYEVACDAK